MHSLIISEHDGNNVVKTGCVMANRIPTSGRDFEIWLAGMFRQLGFIVDVTPQSNDFGADLILKYPRYLDHSIAVQAKFYGNPVSNTPVQEVVASLKVYNAKEGWVVTNSTFTDNARALARANHNVLLIDGTMLNYLVSMADYGCSQDMLDGLFSRGIFAFSTNLNESPSYGQGSHEDSNSNDMGWEFSPSYEETYNLSDVSMRWGCSTSYVKKQIPNGLKMHKMPNGRWQITESDLLEYEQKLKEESETTRSFLIVIGAVAAAGFIVVFFVLALNSCLF